MITKTIYPVLLIALLACHTKKIKNEPLAMDLISYDGSNVKTVTKNDSLGQLKIQGNIINGKKNGYWMTYYPNGQIESIVNYIDNKKEGPYIKFSDENRIGEQGNYVNDLLEGKFIKYHYGYKDEEIDLVHGMKNGWAKKYYSNGQLQYEMQMKNDVQDGLYHFYNESNQLVIEEIFKDGKKQSGGIIKKDQ